MPTPPLSPELAREAFEAYQRHGSKAEAARQLGLHPATYKNRLDKYYQLEAVDPAVKDGMAAIGTNMVPDMMWTKTDKNGNTTHSVMLKPGNTETKDFASAVAEVLGDVVRLPAIPKPAHSEGRDVCTFVPIADWHAGGEYGNPEYEELLNALIDRLISRLPPAEKAVVLELGDLLDANDHRGVTPASENPCDVVRDDHYGAMKLALRLMKRVIYRLAETHSCVEVHMNRGNHDETAYMGVLMALVEHFADIDHVTIVDSVADYRVVPWGECAVFPNHGDKAKWEQLRDVWVTDFPDEWAKAKAGRYIWTGHFHNLKTQELAGVTCEAHRSTAKANRYAHINGWRSKRGINALTLHKTEGEIDRTPVLLRNPA